MEETPPGIEPGLPHGSHGWLMKRPAAAHNRIHTETRAIS